MSIINVTGSVEYSVHLHPATLLINTDDDVATVMGTGYLNGSDTTFGVTYAEDLIALIIVTDRPTPIWMGIEIDGSDINLVAQSTI